MTEVRAAEVAQGHNIPRSTLLHHMRTGQLKGLSTKRGRDWWIEADAVAPFLDWYRTNKIGKGGGGDRRAKA